MNTRIKVHNGWFCNHYCADIPLGDTRIRPSFGRSGADQNQTFPVCPAEMGRALQSLNGCGRGLAGKAIAHCQNNTRAGTKDEALRFQQTESVRVRIWTTCPPGKTLSSSTVLQHDVLTTGAGPAAGDCGRRQYRLQAIATCWCSCCGMTVLRPAAFAS
jgi:hypothetical protein